jgi:hypothetical protein
VLVARVALASMGGAGILLAAARRLHATAAAPVDEGLGEVNPCSQRLPRLST